MSKFERDKRYRIAHAERVNIKKKKWATGKWALLTAKRRKNDPIKTVAYGVVWTAIKRGKLLRPEYCSKCSRKCKPQAHHEDYSKPLEVKWLCRPCHLEGKSVRVWREGDPE